MRRLIIILVSIIGSIDLLFGQAPGTVLHLAADSFVFDDGLGTDPAEDNDNVRLWRDRSGNGLDATPGTPPTFKDDKASRINSMPVIRFNGNNSEVLGLPDDDFLNTRSSGYYNKTLVFVLRTGSSVNDTSVIIEFGGTTNGLNVFIAAGNLYGGVYPLLDTGQGW